MKSIYITTLIPIIISINFYKNYSQRYFLLNIKVRYNEFVKKSILIISDLSSDYGGNYIKSLEAIQSKVFSNDMNVGFVFPIQAQGKEWLKNLKNVFFTDMTLKGWKSCFLEAKKAINFNICHFNFFDEILDVFKSRLMMPKIKLLIFHYHMSIRFENTFYFFIKKVVYKLAYSRSIKICVSNAVANDVKCFSNKNIIVLQNRIDFSRLDIIDKNFSLKGKYNLLIHGNDYFNKGVDIAVKALENLPDTVNLNITVSNAKREALIDFINNSCNCADWNRINLLESRNDVGTYYSSSNIFLSLSRHEAFPYALSEAMYCGCNVIATNIPGQNENVMPGIIWVGNPNKENIVNSVVESINNCIHGKAGINASKEWLLANMSIDSWSDNILKIYNDYFE